MNTNVPPGAVIVLDFLGKTETGRTGMAAYQTIIGHKEKSLAKPITEMTLDELVIEQRRWVKNLRVASGAAGKYQIIRKTLLGLIAELGLPGSTKFTPDVQDRMGMALLRRRGFDAFIAGKMTLNAFALELAKEWASMPVLVDMQGASRQVKAGQSYYAGDGVNKALVTPAELRAVLSEALNDADRQPAPSKPADPVIDYPEAPAKRGITGWLILAGLAAAAIIYLVFIKR